MSIVEIICTIVSSLCAIISTVFAIMSHFKEKKAKEYLQEIVKINNELNLKINSYMFEIKGDINRNIQVFNNFNFPSKYNINDPSVINDNLTELHKKEDK